MTRKVEWNQIDDTWFAYFLEDDQVIDTISYDNFASLQEDENNWVSFHVRYPGTVCTVYGYSDLISVGKTK